MNPARDTSLPDLDHMRSARRRAPLEESHIFGRPLLVADSIIRARCRCTNGLGCMIKAVARSDFIAATCPSNSLSSLRGLERSDTPMPALRARSLGAYFGHPAT